MFKIMFIFLSLISLFLTTPACSAGVVSSSTLTNVVDKGGPQPQRIRKLFTPLLLLDFLKLVLSLGTRTSHYWDCLPTSQSLQCSVLVLLYMCEPAQT